MKQIIPFLVLFLFGCGPGEQANDTADTAIENAGPIAFYGSTQGTTFSVISNDPIELTMDELTGILADFDMALSGYIPESTVSRLNQSQAGEFTYDDPYDYFNRCYKMAQEVYGLTNGAFDPTVYPLVDGWGFMKNLEVVPDSATVDSLRAFLGFENGYHFDFHQAAEDSNAFSITKNTPQAMLDFNAIAQGLAVDVLAEELEKRGSKNYFVEIGGEIRVKGLNSDGEIWRIGIDKPVEGSDAADRELQEIVNVQDKSIATSGSYRKFYEKDGIKYSHTLDPNTGYPVTHSLLSATVVAGSCAMADALATSFMVMGVEKSKAFLKAHPGLDVEAYLIFINEHSQYETYYTRNFGKMIVL